MTEPGAPTTAEPAVVAGADREDLVAYLLRLGDDALIGAQRLAEWSGRAPELEEDVALTNLALDLLGQARTLLSYAGEVEGRGRDEDALAFGRDEREFRNCQLVELADRDFADLVARLLLYGGYAEQLYARLAESTDATLAALAAKAVKEAAYHRDHAVTWTLRLGDGTTESSRRLQAALDRRWPYLAELFERDELVGRLADAGVAVDPAALAEPVERLLTEVLTQATLRRPEPDWHPTGGRQGRHTEQLGYLLAEMQHLPRSHPGARW